MAEHAALDLVAYLEGRFHRIQVKYRKADASGAVEVAFVSIWSDRNGVHKQAVDKTEIDLYCVYCPDTDECYYVRPQACSASVSLRITQPQQPTRRRLACGGISRHSGIYPHGV